MKGIGQLKPYPASERRAIQAEMVVVMTNARNDANRVLMEERSRALRKFDVHELLVTIDEAGPDGLINRVAFLGFFEVIVAGLLVAGDRLVTEKGEIGHVAGFDPHHMPNHLNVVVNAQALHTGERHGLRVGTPITFQPPPTPT